MYSTDLVDLGLEGGEVVPELPHLLLLLPDLLGLLAADLLDLQAGAGLVEVAARQRSLARYLQQAGTHSYQS
jgi:hypothetical protein